MFTLPLFYVVLQPPMALFLPPAIQRSVMPRYTTQMGRAQAVPAFTSIHACVCQATQFPASTWLRAASTAAAETSRPRCPLGGGTPTMQLFSTRVRRRSNGPLAFIAGTKQRDTEPSHASMNARFLSSMKCVWHVGWMHCSCIVRLPSSYL